MTRLARAVNRVNMFLGRVRIVARLIRSASGSAGRSRIDPSFIRVAARPLGRSRGASQLGRQARPEAEQAPGGPGCPRHVPRGTASRKDGQPGVLAQARQPQGGSAECLQRRIAGLKALPGQRNQDGSRIPPAAAPPGGGPSR